MYVYINDSERKALQHLQSCMAKWEFGSKEYDLARRAYGFIANKIVIRRRTDEENLDGIISA